MLHADTMRTLPKALLHDHLDGGLRPKTILELADEIGHSLPSTNEAELSAWFVRGADTRDLNQYLATFEHTIAVMQQPDHCHRVAREAALDLAADGVVYAEVRFAPENHVGTGMSMDDTMEAVQDGFRAGMAEATEAGTPIIVNTIVSAMRQADRSSQVAELALRWRQLDTRVVGFDLAGPETGFPPTDHPEALELVRQGHLPLTLHASEPPGLELISQSLACGAIRIGHGIRLYEDIEVSDEGMDLGHVARYIRDQQIHLEMAPSCHVHVGAVESFEQHPLVTWHRAGFNVGVNTDNRLMSGVSVSSEFRRLVETFELTTQEMCELTKAALQSGFGPLDERQRLISDVVEPAYGAVTR